MRRECRTLLATCAALSLTIITSCLQTSGAPEPIVSVIDLHFVSPNLETSPVGSATAGDSVRITSYSGMNGQQNWTKMGVVLDLGSPGNLDSWEVNTPSVLFDSGLFKMWYAGTDGTFPDTWIHYATSSDGVDWVRHGVVLDFGPPGENENVHMPAVIKDGSLFRMWYAGYDGSHYRIFQATSPDGFVWTRYGLAMDLGPAGSYDSMYLLYPFVLLEGSTYKMWYTGYDGSRTRLLLATSTDGFTWSKQGLALDIGPPSSQDSFGVSRATILKEGDGYHMWYTGVSGTTQRIFYATSSNGLAWTRRGRVLDVGPPGGTEAYSVYACSVLHVLGMPYQMWYTGRDGSGATDRIHYAYMDPIFQPLSIEVRFYLDSVTPAALIGSDFTQVGVLSPAAAWFDWIADPPGLHTIFAVIDPLNSIPETNEDNNAASLSFLVLPTPSVDYVPTQPQPSGTVSIGLALPLQLSAKVLNQGLFNANVSTTLAFLNESSVQLATFDVPPLDSGTYSSRFAFDWVSPAVPCTRRFYAIVDSNNEIAEGNETNNVYAWTINVVPGPQTSLVITPPRYDSTKTFVRSFSPLDFIVLDMSGTGVRNTIYRIDGSAWRNYTLYGRFRMSGEGEHLLEWRSLDYAGNLENISSKMISVDDTPPETVIAPSIGPFTPETLFNLTATDDGSGVSRTEYMIDSTQWIVYGGSIQVPAGIHTIWFRSIDNIGNIEAEKGFEVKTDTEPPPTIGVEMNYKPIVACVFTLILILAGFFSSRRRPWKGEHNGKAVLKAFAATSLPFWAAELVTGLLSLSTGVLSIPPIVGIGTAVDLTILLTGTITAIVWSLKAKPVDSSKRATPI